MIVKNDGDAVVVTSKRNDIEEETELVSSELVAITPDSEKITISSDSDLMAAFMAKNNISATFISEKYVTNSSSGIVSFVHKPLYDLIAKNIVMDYKDGSKYAFFSHEILGHLLLNYSFFHTASPIYYELFRINIYA